MYGWTKWRCLRFTGGWEQFVCLLVVMCGIECVSVLPVWQHCWVVWSAQRFVSLPPPPSLSPYPVALSACRNLSAGSTHTHTHIYSSLEASSEQLSEGKHYASRISVAFTLRRRTKLSLGTTERFCSIGNTVVKHSAVWRPQREWHHAESLFQSERASTCQLATYLEYSMHIHT